MKSYNVKIKGLTPYMQHRMDDQKLEQWEKQRGPIHERPELVHEDQVRAEYHSYQTHEGEYYIPAEQLRGRFNWRWQLCQS